MQFFEWVRERKFYMPEEMESSSAMDIFDPEYHVGVYEYPAGFIFENKVDDDAPHPTPRYGTIIGIEEFFSDRLALVEVWLWKNWCRDELGQDDVDPLLDPQLG